MSIEQLMIQHDIERIVRVPDQHFSDFTVRGSWHAWPFGAWLAEHCGRGATIEEAIHDAVRRRQQEAA